MKVLLVKLYKITSKIIMLYLRLDDERTLKNRKSAINIYVKLRSQLNRDDIYNMRKVMIKFRECNRK
jgi:hypothetical protein